MSLTRNVYSDEPAFPILADSLLPQPDNGRIVTNEQSHASTDSNGWNLKRYLDEGIQFSETTIFRSGTIIGFSRLRTRTKDNDDYIAQIPRYLLIKCLAENFPEPSGPSAFIIFPNGFEAFSPRTLLNALQAHPTEPKLSREKAIKILDTVQLLPVQNFLNAAQAIRKVAESLQQIGKARQTSETLPKNQHVLLIIAGLDTLAEGVIRASNPVRGTALLSATLRNLNCMSRTHASYLSTFLVNTNGLGPANFESNYQKTPNQTVPQDQGSRLLSEDGIHSIFQPPGSTLLPTLLMKTLDQGIDTHILLSDVKTSQVAEVVKSRLGPGLGEWSTWTLT